MSTAPALEPLRNLPGYKGGPDKFTANCPGHEDRVNSLSVRVVDDKVSVHCFAGCDIQNILAPLDLKLRDLYPPRTNGNGKPKKQFECAYDYVDGSGNFVFQVVRYKPKSFRQRRPNPNNPGAWIWNLRGIEPRPLYRLPDILAATTTGQTIYLCEGEKDADALMELGLVATTNAGGTATWTKTDAAQLEGANVIVLADNDDPGIKGAWKRADSIPGAVVLQLPDLPEKGDVSDWLASGGTLPDLEALIAQARENPPQRPVEGAPADEDKRLFSDAPLDLARYVLKRNFDQGSLRYWGGHWYVFTEVCFRAMDSEELRNACYQVLEGCTYEVSNGSDCSGVRTFVPNTRSVTQVIDAMRSLDGVTIASDKTFPLWLVDNPENLPTDEYLALQNGLLHVPTMTLRAHTNDFFTLNALNYSYDSKAAPPVAWFEFLRASLPGDKGKKALLLLQEWFGYCLCSSIQHQKILWLMGATRGGKGTVLRALRRLLGEMNCTTPEIDQLGEQFGLESFIGKRAALFGDVRLKQNGLGNDMILDRVLRLSGGDPIQIPRKYQSSLELELNTRLTFASNPPPPFKDLANALAARLMVIDFTVSFEGREDHTLDKRIAAELPGLLNWSLDGLERLKEQGGFTKIESQMLESYVDESNPIGRFLRENCNMIDDGIVQTGDLYNAWTQWCAENEEHCGSNSAFGTQLITAAPGINKKKLSKPDDSGKRPYYYHGLELNE